VIGPGGDAAVLRLKGSTSGLAISSEVNPSYCYLDPRTGGAQAVAEAVRNLACVGARPVGLSDCLNFGNPENPEIAWQLRESIRGISTACRALEVPVVSGNVSLYNETDGVSIHPTPTVVVVGTVPSVENLPSSRFTRPDQRIVLLGETGAQFGGSAYLRLLHDIEQGRPPKVDLEAEARLAELLRILIFNGQLSTVHDLSEGGFAVALAEGCFGSGIGARVQVPMTPTELFEESQARALVACAPGELADLMEAAEQASVPAREIGATGGSEIFIRAEGAEVRLDLRELEERWTQALPRAMETA